MTISLMPGDVFCTRGTTWLSRMIRVCERTPRESASVVNHCGIIVGYGSIATARMVEADIRVHTTTLGKEYGGRRDMVAIYRPLGLDYRTLGNIAQDAMKMVGKRYGIFEIPLHAADWLLSRIARKEMVAFRRIAREDHTVICSGLVAQCFANHTDWRFCGKAPNVVQPDDIWDDWTDAQKGHPSRWLRVMALQRI